jgi:hypothetical protein
MKLLGADADLRSEAEFIAVGKPGGGVDVNGSCVNFI